MNWDALGAIGEIVGALAVVASLTYLAIQTRANTKALKTNASLHQTNTFIDVVRSTYENPEVTDLVVLLSEVKAIEELSKRDYMRAHSLLSANMKAAEQNYHQWKNGNLSDEEWLRISEGFNAFMASLPVLIELWKAGSYVHFPQEFVDHLNNQIAEMVVTENVTGQFSWSSRDDA